MDTTAHRVGVADILRRFGPTYRATHALSATRAKVWRALVACRTAALGGHLEACDTCGSMRLVYHSCRNRHCPLCQTRAKEAWLAQRQRELLPVPYFHLVFTLPHDLNWLIEQQPRAIYQVAAVRLLRPQRSAGVSPEGESCPVWACVRVLRRRRVGALHSPLRVLTGISPPIQVRSSQSVDGFDLGVSRTAFVTSVR